MKRFFIFLFAVMALAFVQCTPQETKETPEKTLSVSLASSVDLPYGDNVSVNYTCSDASGNVSVSASGVPSGVTFKSEGSDSKGGTFTLQSLLDEDKTVTVTLTFKDSKTSCTKDLSVTTHKAPETLLVSTTVSELDIMKGEKAILQYTTKAANGNVNVAFKTPVEGLTLTNVYSKEEGTVTFSSSISEEKTVEVVLVFSDSKVSVEKPLTIKNHIPTEKPSAVTVDADSRYVYPAETNHATTLSFTVMCADVVSEVSVAADDGLRTELSLADDKKSGTVKVYAGKAISGDKKVTITAGNNGGTASKEVTLTAAYLDIDTEAVSVPSAGTTSPRGINVSTNLKFAVEAVFGGFVDVSVDGSRILLSVGENVQWEDRTQTVTVSDEDKIIKRTISVTQAKTTGSTASDRAALMAIYESMNMKEWDDAEPLNNDKVFAPNYRFWGIPVDKEHFPSLSDASGDPWAGTYWTGYQGQGRCWELDFYGEQPKSTGVLPEEISHLTCLKEFTVCANHNLHTPLPNSVAEMVSLKSLAIIGNNLNINLSEWTGLMRLLDNPNKNITELCFSEDNLHGEYPAWLTKLGEKGSWSLARNHLSGRIPDEVANMYYAKKINGVRIWEVEGCPAFDVSKFEPAGTDGVSVYMMRIEYDIYTQKDNYALWIGERPENTKWVEDEFGGHWEWVVD